MKLYLDADVFLALAKEQDRHKKAALAFFERYPEAEKITSTIACMEVWFYLYKNGNQRKALDALRAISSLCSVVDFTFRHIEQAVLLAADHQLSPADALHAILAQQADAVVSSDHSFDRIPALKRINFTKE